MSRPEAVYVVAVDAGAARDWVHRNKPAHEAKVFHPDSSIGPRGLQLSDGTPVYVFDWPSTAVREAWAMTGGRLVHV